MPLMINQWKSYQALFRAEMQYIIRNGWSSPSGPPLFSLRIISNRNLWIIGTYVTLSLWYIFVHVNLITLYYRIPKNICRIRNQHIVCRCYMKYRFTVHRLTLSIKQAHLSSLFYLFFRGYGFWLEEEAFYDNLV